MGPEDAKSRVSESGEVHRLCLGMADTGGRHVRNIGRNCVHWRHHYIAGMCGREVVRHRIRVRSGELILHPDDGTESCLQYAHLRGASDGCANIGPTGIWTVMATAKIGTRELSAIAMTFVKVRILLFWCPGSGDPSTCAH